ncbi:MAG: hypothetical protein ABUT20_50945 [Bacteroidota bacterium]
MIKNPFDALVQYAKDKLERDRKTNEFIYTQSDSLITWLVGFAFAALSLIVSNLNSLRVNFHNDIKPVIFCLTLTIVAGLAFRYVSYLVMIFHKNLDNYFAGIFSDFEMTPIETDEDIETADFNYIAKRLKDDFNEVIPALEKLSESDKEIELPNLINHYKKLCQHSAKQLKIGLDYIADINETAYRVNKKITLDQFNKELKKPNIGYNQKKWNRIRTWLYTLCILSFTTAVLTVSFYLLFNY